MKLIKVVIGSAAFSLVVTLITAALSIYGIIDMEAARILLFVAWLIGTAGVVTSEIVCSRPWKHVVSVGLVAAVIFASGLIWLDHWAASKKKELDAHTALHLEKVTKAPSPPAFAYKKAPPRELQSPSGAKSNQQQSGSQNTQTGPIENKGGCTVVTGGNDNNPTVNCPTVNQQDGGEQPLFIAKEGSNLLMRNGIIREKQHHQILSVEGSSRAEVDNLTIIQGEEKENLTYQEEPAGVDGELKILRVHVHTDTLIPVPQIGILLSGPIAIPEQEPEQEKERDKPKLIGFTEPEIKIYWGSMSHNGVPIDYGISVYLSVAFSPDQEIIVTVRSKNEVHVKNVGELRN